MLRRFNYTGRIRLQRDDVRFSLHEEGEGAWRFDAAIKLEEYDLPNDAFVSVEAYRQTTWMRFDFGLVGAQAVPDNRLLHEFDSPEGVLFRVRVTSRGTPEDPHGLLLAEADRIPLAATETVEDPRESLLPVIPADLGDELWRVDFDDRPRLLFNSAAGNYKQIGLDPLFISIVYPAAFREVLGHILHREEHNDYDDPDDPLSRWLKFAVEVLGAGEPPTPEEDEAVDEWIDTAIRLFARKHGLLAKFTTYWTQEDRE